MILIDIEIVIFNGGFCHFDKEIPFTGQDRFGFIWFDIQLYIDILTEGEHVDNKHRYAVKLVMMI